MPACMDAWVCDGRGFTYPPATKCDHDLANDSGAVLSGRTSPVSLDCVICGGCEDEGLVGFVGLSGFPGPDGEGDGVAAAMSRRSVIWGRCAMTRSGPQMALQERVVDYVFLCSIRDLATMKGGGAQQAVAIVRSSRLQGEESPIDA